MPGSKDNMDLNYLLLLFPFFSTKWISQPVFLSFARQEPDCTFQQRDLARYSSLPRSSFHFSLDLIIFQADLLAAPTLNITLKNIYEQMGEQLGCHKALHHCQSRWCPFPFNQFSAPCPYSLHPLGCRQRSCHLFCHTWFLQVFRNIKQHFPTHVWTSMYFLIVGCFWTSESFRRVLVPLGAVPKRSRLDFLPSSTCFKKAKDNLINLSEKLGGLKSFVPNARKVEVLFFLTSYKW